MKILVHSIITFATIKVFMFHFRKRMSIKAKQLIATYDRRRAVVAQRISDSEKSNLKGFNDLMFG